VADILFEELAPVLNYFPVKIGKAEMVFHSPTVFQLMYDGIQYCSFNVKGPHAYTEILEQFVEYNLAEGKVVTTGLGFGLLQTLLSKKPTVSEVIVYEKHEDIIRMFELFVRESNFDASKIQIINQPAVDSVVEECDWLVLDHFEDIRMSEWEILDIVRDIHDRSNAKNLLFWPMPIFYTKFCSRKSLQCNDESYSMYHSATRLSKMPNKLPNDCFNKFNYFKKPLFQSALQF